jgi:hypothetical protein
MSETDSPKPLSGFLLFPDNDKRAEFLADPRVAGQGDNLVESRFRPFLTYTDLPAARVGELMSLAQEHGGSHEEARQYFPV